ncbi:hypothetical protein JW978_00415 [Candidatus Dojkabacteria bacterium]|nr:hypothetical protein [Candidatus Dojkabacteria bacterium]
MPTKSSLSDIKKNILKMFIQGKSQTEIFDELEDSFKGKPKKLQMLIRENAFLSPKNFKYGSFLVFFVAYLSPVFAVYMKGYDYSLLIRPILTLSLILSTPFLWFAIVLYFTKDLRKISSLSIGFLIYYVIYLITFLTIAIDIHVWTIVLFPVVIFPTMLFEWAKLRAFILELEDLESLGSDSPKN